MTNRSQRSNGSLRAVVAREGCAHFLSDASARRTTDLAPRDHRSCRGVQENVRMVIPGLRRLSPESEPLDRPRLAPRAACPA
jgi:hypothetical protein